MGQVGKINDQLGEELAKARKGLNEATTELDHLNFLLKVGDWCDAVHGAVKYYEEKTAKSNHWNTNVIDSDEQECKDYHTFVDKLPEKTAKGYATNSREWAAVRGHWCTSVVGTVDPEVQRVKKWKGSVQSSQHTPIWPIPLTTAAPEAGEDASHAPHTPYLDRLDRLCQDAGLSRVQYLDIARMYSERNEAAHTPRVQLIDHIDPATKTVDWYAVKNACEGSKSGIQKDLEDGRLTLENHSFFVDTVDHWLRMHVSSWPTGSAPVLTKFGEFELVKIEGQYKKSGHSAHDPHHGPSYKKGKWDDL